MKFYYKPLPRLRQRLPFKHPLRQRERRTLAQALFAFALAGALVAYWLRH